MNDNIIDDEIAALLIIYWCGLEYIDFMEATLSVEDLEA